MLKAIGKIVDTRVRGYDGQMDTAREFERDAVVVTIVHTESLIKLMGL